MVTIVFTARWLRSSAPRASSQNYSWNTGKYVTHGFVATAWFSCLLKRKSSLVVFCILFQLTCYLNKGEVDLLWLR